jgi:hypothetical protein
MHASLFSVCPQSNGFVSRRVVSLKRVANGRDAWQQVIEKMTRIREFEA